MLADVMPSLVVVMGGYAKDNQLRPWSRRWLRGLRSISTKLVLIYDQDQLLGCQSSAWLQMILRLWWSAMAPMTLAPPAWTSNR